MSFRDRCVERVPPPGSELGIRQVTTGDGCSLVVDFHDLCWFLGKTDKGEASRLLRDFVERGAEIGVDLFPRRGESNVDRVTAFDGQDALVGPKAGTRGARCGDEPGGCYWVTLGCARSLAALVGGERGQLVMRYLRDLDGHLWRERERGFAVALDDARAELSRERSRVADLGRSLDAMRALLVELKHRDDLMAQCQGLGGTRGDRVHGRGDRAGS